MKRILIPKSTLSVPRVHFFATIYRAATKNPTKNGIDCDILILHTVYFGYKCETAFIQYGLIPLMGITPISTTADNCAIFGDC